MKIILNAILCIGFAQSVLAQFAFAGDGHSNSKSNVEAKNRKPADTSSTSLFKDTVLVEEDQTRLTLGTGYRLYDKKHKVVCYSFYGTRTLTCAPSAATE